MSTSVSTLNPRAISFIPSTSASQTETLPTKVLAQILIHEFVKDKKRRGERDVTKSELVHIIEKIICARYGVNNGKHVRSIKAYISAKLSRLLPGGKIGFKEGQRRTNVRYRFDMSVVTPLKPNAIASFWGLHRHEIAVKPTMTLSYRPQSFKDRVWSIQEDDLKIWNPCYAKQCDCPPMFGYSVPPDFFGNPFNLSHKCTINTVHLGHYPESSVERDSLLMRNYVGYEEDLEPFKDDYEDKINVEVNLDVYLEEMKSIVAGVCSLLPDKEGVEDDTAIQSSYDFYDNFEETTESLWDSDPFPSEVDGAIEDEDYHPLLEEAESLEKGIFDDEYPQFEREFEECEISGTCNPPCSNWCHSSPKSERLQRTMSSSIISLFNDTTDFLLNTCQIDSAEEFSKPSFHRSYSASDCDSSYNEKYKNGTPTTSTSLEDLKVDNCTTFVKRLRDIDSSWDNDSGFVSSQDDFSDPEKDGEVGREEPARMWSIFSAEDSLWKPLPECTSQDQPALQKRSNS